MTALPVFCAPYDDEGAMSFINRALVRNASSVKDALQFHRKVYRRHVQASDAVLFSELTCLPPDWFAWRIPRNVARDRWTEIELFGMRWRNDWLLRGTHQQVCPQCLHEGGFCRLEWDLQAYAACHIHGVVLQDTCRACGKAILADRPSVEVCACGGCITSFPSDAPPAPEPVVRWCQWLSRRLTSATEMPTEAGDADVPALCAGCSPDGAFRLIQAMAGGPRGFKGALMESSTPWLNTETTVELLLAGLETLEAMALKTRRGRTHDKGSADALSEQAVRGVTPWDRATAARLAGVVGAKSRWRNVKPVIHQQLELFEVQQ